MRRKYGIALVGCGYMGAAHLDEIYYRENIEVRWVIDTDPVRAETFKRKYGALFSGTNAEDCLKDDQVDIVLIATYPSSHLALMKACLACGKHVLCEKPIAPSKEEAREFAGIVRNAMQKVLVGHVLRHNSTYRKVAEMIDGGAIGSPIAIRMVQNKHTSRDWGRYLELLKQASPVVDCGVHYIDIMQWFTRSRITSISGIGMPTEEGLPEGVCNYNLFTARLADGSVAYFESGWGNTIASEDLKEFIGPKGRIRITYERDRCSHREEGDLIEYYRYPGNEYVIINNPEKRKPTWEQFDHLIRMIEEDIPASPDIDQVLEAFEIAAAADEAIAAGKTITLDPGGSRLARLHLEKQQT